MEEEHEHHAHHDEHEGDSGNASEVKMVTRNFRYMRRKPTIIAYKPPEGITKMFSTMVYHQLQNYL